MSVGTAVNKIKLASHIRGCELVARFTIYCIITHITQYFSHSRWRNICWFQHLCVQDCNYVINTLLHITPYYSILINRLRRTIISIYYYLMLFKQTILLVVCVIVIVDAVASWREGVVNRLGGGIHEKAPFAILISTYKVSTWCQKYENRQNKYTWRAQLWRYNCQEG